VLLAVTAILVAFYIGRFVYLHFDEVRAYKERIESVADVTEKK
jgi:hypothetical protein